MLASGLGFFWYSFFSFDLLRKGDSMKDGIRREDIFFQIEQYVGGEGRGVGKVRRDWDEHKNMYGFTRSTNTPRLMQCIPLVESRIVR